MADNKFMSKIKQMLNVKGTDTTAVVNDKAEYRSMSNTELKSVLKGVYVPDNLASRQIIDKMMLPAMLEPIGKELIDKQLDNSKLLSLAPEIEQAASILIPSILSPNDFRKNIFKVELEMTDLDDTARLKITELLDLHFGETLALSTKLSIWLDDAIFKVGSKAVMVFPTNSIANIMKVGTVRTGSATEGLSAVEGLSTKMLGDIEKSYVKLHTDKVVGKMEKDEDGYAKTTAALEAMFSAEESNTDTNSRKVRKTIKDGIGKINAVLKDKSQLIYTDDPRVLFSSKFKNAAALEAIDSKILKKLGGESYVHTFLDRDESSKKKRGKSDPINDAIQYKTSPYLDLSEFISEDEPSKFPALIEVPSESIIPIIVDGSPENHIGYFVLLNENGNPITAENDSWQDMMNTQSSDTQVNQLFNSFYGSSQFTLSKMMASNAKAEVVGSIYESYIKNLLTSKLEDQGFNGVAIQMNQDVSRVMLYRLLKNTETRILFVPKQLMHYLAFDYHPDGTGRSKLDQIKFPLSLKITLIITRLISLIESAVNRTKLTVSLDDTVGNPLEILRMVRKEVLKSKMYGISYDPSTIIKGIVEKSLTVVPDKIPGVESFNISDEPNNVTYPVPDDALLSEINNMYMLSLDVPPSAMNRLGEDEFSRSVASNNIFFSNKLKEHQTVACKFMTQLIRGYIKHSKGLQDEIADILKANDGKAKDNGGGEATVDNGKLREVIENIKFTLPSPSLSIDHSNFEELHDYMDIIEQVLAGLFPPELTSNSELADTINTLKSNIKHKLLMEHISANSLLSELNFDALNNMQISEITDITQKIMNLKAALDLQKKAFGTPSEGEGADAAPAEGSDDAGGAPVW